MGDHACFDDAIMNVAMNFYEDRYSSQPPTEAELDKLGSRCYNYYRQELRGIVIQVR